MKSFAALPAATALLLALAAAPAFAGARYDTGASRTPDATTTRAAAQTAPDATTRASYGANSAPRAEAGAPATLHATQDPFTINGRSLYDQP
jgi:hypothetical protein